MPAVVVVIWDNLFLNPMLNSLVVLYSILFHNFGLTIIFFTVIVRILTMPLTMKQIRSTRKMSEIKPKIDEVKRRYAKDSRRVSQETMRLYKESGVNPLGCLGPMVIQFPIWIGLYQAVISLLPTTPEAMARLSQHLYSWIPFVNSAVPLNKDFLWLDLGVPDPTKVVMPVLVGASMWVQQKMTAMPGGDPRTESTNRTMLWMMPIMFGFFTLSFPSGLALYWFASAAIGIGIQYYTAGWGGLFTERKGPVLDSATQVAGEEGSAGESGEEATRDGQRGDNSQNRGGGDRDRAPGARRRTRGSRRRGH